MPLQRQIDLIGADIHPPYPCLGYFFTLISIMSFKGTIIGWDIIVPEYWQVSTKFDVVGCSLKKSWQQFNYPLLTFNNKRMFVTKFQRAESILK